MELKLKKLKRALFIVRFLNGFAATAFMVGFIGLVGTAGNMEMEPDMPFGKFVLMSAICLVMMFIGGYILDNLDGASEALKERITKLSRKIRLTKAMAKRQIEAEKANPQKIAI